MSLSSPSTSTLAAAPDSLDETFASPAIPRSDAIQSHAVLVLLLIAGTALRLYQYLWDRDLWVDEAALGLNLITRGFGELLGPLEYSQVAPYGFLALERIAVLTLGGSERALRLLPFLAAVAALPLFWFVARRLVSREAALVALALFAASPRIVYYGAEVKQYSFDVVIGLAIVFGVCWLTDRDWPSRYTIPVALAGPLAVLLSHTAVFYLAAAGALMVYEQRTHLRRDAFRLMAVGASWAGGFAVTYMFSRWAIADPQHVKDWWTGGFLPLPPASAADLLEWGRALLRMFRDPLEFTIPALALGAAAVGIVSLAFRRRYAVVWLLAAPILLTMLASGVRAYPFGDDASFGGRVLLFLVPPTLILVAEGVDRIRSILKVTPIMLGLVLLAGYLLPRIDPAVLVPIYRAVPSAVRWVFIPHRPPFDTDYSQPVGRVMAELTAQHHTAHEPIYVYATPLPTWDFYSERLGLGHVPVYRGSALGDDQEAVDRDLNMLRNHDRVWLFLAYTWHGSDEPFLLGMQQLGVPLAILRDGQVKAILYELHTPVE